MGNYRIDAAAGTALVLGAMSLLLISLFERLAARR
jgi:ABC-type Fe3+ transport system permease subunit